MKSVSDIRDEIDRLIDRYTGIEFKHCTVAERGYHLVRALDQLVGDGWFWPDKPVISYQCKGPDEIKLTLTEYPPLKYTITLVKGDSDVARFYCSSF